MCVHSSKDKAFINFLRNKVPLDQKVSIAPEEMQPSEICSLQKLRSFINRKEFIDWSQLYLLYR